MALRKPKKADLLVDPDQYKSPQSEFAEIDADTRKRIDDHLQHRIRLGGHITYEREDGVSVIEDKNGIRPLSEVPELPTPPESAELTIREMAWMNRIHVSRDGLDDWADTVTRLADDEVEFDEVQELIVAMRKAKVVDGIELTKLHARYLEERDA